MTTALTRVPTSSLMRLAGACALILFVILSILPR
jgi:hypothetical protein